MDYNSLKKLVAHHDHLYYDLNNPVLTDEEYDSLYEQLIEIENKQGWKDADSPTAKIIAKGKVKHPTKLYSLKKVYDEADVPREFTVKLPKLDGVNLSITYKNKQLNTCLTRGDGETGESVMHLVHNIRGIPESINIETDCVFVGEVLTDNKVDNFRNYVAGALGLKEADEVKSRNLRFVVHDVLLLEENYLARMEFARSVGFDTVDVGDYSDYPQDGVVFRLNSYEDEQELGYTAKYPRFAVALKHKESFSAATYLKDIEWTIGRSGVVTPVGILEPVVLDGATVSRVILHNYDFVVENNLKRGDLILIERRITPQFVKVIEHSNYTPFTIEDANRALNTELVKKGPKLYISESENHRYVEYFVKTLGIKGLGEATIKKLGLYHPADIFKIKDWSIIGKNGDKIAEELSRPKDYPTVLAALGIPGVGKTTAALIAENIPRFDDLETIATKPIRGIGPSTIQSILSWIEINKYWVYELPYALEHTPTKVISGSKKIAITGKLDLTKQELIDRLSMYGFVLSNTVTKDCYALITGGEESSKTKTATKYGIPIFNYWKHKAEILRGEF
jgi:DNA ligase (NAD+)